MTFRRRAALTGTAASVGALAFPGLWGRSASAASAASATAAPPSSTTPASPPPRIVSDLYGNRLLFGADGRPRIPLGMMQGQRRVVLRSTASVRVEVDGDALELPPNQAIVVEHLGGTPARMVELQVVETLEGEDRRRKQDAIKSWAHKGLAVRGYDVGGVYGVKGTVVDNRAVLIATTEPVPSSLNARPVPVEWLLAEPSTRLRVTTPVAARDGQVVRVVAEQGSITVEKVEHSVGYAEHGFEDRLLREEVLVLADKRGYLAVVNIVDENVMVAGVLPSEMFATAPLEALKAQAVTARGELFAKVGRRHFADPFLVCTEQHCQVYRGQTAESPRTNEAAQRTAGELAFKDGHVVDSVYSACCGGHTEPAEVVWDKPPRPELVGTRDAPGLPSPTQRLPSWLPPAAASSFFGVVANADGQVKPAPLVPARLETDDAVRAFLDVPRDAAWCGRSTFNQKGTAWRWEKRFTVDEVSALTSSLGVGRVRALQVNGRGPGGRLRALRIVGDRGEAEVLRELPVRRLFKNLRSGLFVVDEERDAGGLLVAFVLRGGGFGHGSGMCQQGAIGLAEAGASYTEILAHYYNGAVVERVF